MITRIRYIIRFVFLCFFNINIILMNLFLEAGMLRLDYITKYEIDVKISIEIYSLLNFINGALRMFILSITLCRFSECIFSIVRSQ